MMKHLLLSTESRLLGTPLFIAKAAVAMFFGFWLGSLVPVANRDMISFLFGMMLTLEPVNTTGLKRGKDQFIATLTGGVVSAAIIFVAGITPVGLALSIGAILYLTLHRNWRELSVVALFTGIYMTQFIQFGAQGDPSILMTMVVRVFSLSTGIAFAMVFNLVFSLISLKHFPRKRLCFLYYRLNRHLTRLIEKLRTDQALVDSAHLSLAYLFNDIDWTVNLLSDLREDPLLKWVQLPLETVDDAIKKAKDLRTFSHYLFDLEIALRGQHATEGQRLRLELAEALDAFNLRFCDCQQAIEAKKGAVNQTIARTLLESALAPTLADPDCPVRIKEDLRTMLSLV